MFEQMHALILGRNINFSVIKRQVIVHLSVLLDKFNSHFHEFTEEQAASFQWIVNSFTENIEEQLPTTSRIHTLGRAR